MAKVRTRFVCSACGSMHPKWMGKCPDCGVWDALESFVEPKTDQVAETHGTAVATWLAEEGVPTAVRAAQALPLAEISVDDVPRIPTGIGELDRVLGGGLVPGSVVLLGGEPGIGKSTLLLQTVGRLASRTQASPVLYVSSEESAQQIRLRADRILASASSGVGGGRTSGDEPVEGAGSGLDPERVHRQLFVLAETNLARVVEQARRVQPAVCVIDSIQMIYRGDLEAAPGSVAQLRRCCIELVYLAKASGMAIVVVGHLTKDGQFAGPKMLEHLVDVVLSFEGDRDHGHRIVRGVKNRFGSTLEIGLFEMTGTGLDQVPEGGVVVDPAAPPNPGTVICPSLHGSRCLLAEVQALTATGIMGAARRKTSGLDSNRLAMIIAVLEKHGGLRLADQDVYAAVAGGLRVVEPAIDLAVLLAVAGAHLRRSLPPGTAVVGEVGLSGEIRPLQHPTHRAAEAARHGFRRLIGPQGGGIRGCEEIVLEGVRTVGEAIERLEAVSGGRPIAV
ncbi:MAG: DNA repair protein RadA [Phycisphaerales bacterium]|nr:DNA repair protein RadA [Phycisphaerales bacterium]